MASLSQQQPGGVGRNTVCKCCFTPEQSHLFQLAVHAHILVCEQSPLLLQSSPPLLLTRTRIISHRSSVDSPRTFWLAHRRRHEHCLSLNMVCLSLNMVYKPDAGAFLTHEQVDLRELQFLKNHLPQTRRHRGLACLPSTC